MRTIALAVTLVLLSGQLVSAACITDDTGEKVCLDTPPHRAVSLYGAFTETLAALGCADSLVARTKNDDSVPEVAKLPSVGTGLRPNVELLLALRPDLIVGRGGKAGREALEALRARGLKVAAFDPSGLAQLYETAERLGTLWGREADARRLVENLRADVARVEKRAKPGSRRPRVVYEVRAEPLTVAGSGGLVDDLIQAAGGENAVRSPKKLLAVDPEELLHLDPDAYIVQVGPMNPSPVNPGDRPALRALRAVRQGRVLSVDEDLFARPGPHVAEAAERLSRFLLPEAWGARK